MSLSKLETNHLKCRSWRHAWDLEMNVVQVLDRRRVYELNLACLRCGATRVDTYLPGQGLLSRAYGHPEHYLVDGEEVDSYGGRARFNVAVSDELVKRVTRAGKDSPKLRTVTRRATG